MLFSEIRRACRHWLADRVVALVRCTNLGDDIGGFILKVWHFNAPWTLVTNAALLPRFGALLSLFTMTLALCLYLALGGCFLSEAEEKLGVGDLNVVDPYIRLFGQTIDTQARYEFTVFGAYFAYFLVLSILHLRGII